MTGEKFSPAAQLKDLQARLAFNGFSGAYWNIFDWMAFPFLVISSSVDFGPISVKTVQPACLIFWNG